MFYTAAGKFCRGKTCSAPNDNIVPQRIIGLGEEKCVPCGRNLANNSMHIREKNYKVQKIMRTLIRLPGVYIQQQVEVTLKALLLTVYKSYTLYLKVMGSYRRFLSNSYVINGSVITTHFHQDATIKKQKTVGIGEDVEKLEHLCAVDGNAKLYSCCGKQHGGPSKN